MSKHTPGPWVVKVETDTRYCTLTGKPRHRSNTWICSGTEHLALMSGEHSNLPVEANARLFSAAPEMFEAIGELRDLFTAKTAKLFSAEPEVMSRLVDCFKSMEAAYRKAEGRE